MRVKGAPEISLHLFQGGEVRRGRPSLPIRQSHAHAQAQAQAQAVRRRALIIPVALPTLIRVTGGQRTGDRPATDGVERNKCVRNFSRRERCVWQKPTRFQRVALVWSPSRHNRR